MSHPRLSPPLAMFQILTLLTAVGPHEQTGLAMSPVRSPEPS